MRNFIKYCKLALILLFPNLIIAEDSDFKVRMNFGAGYSYEVHNIPQPTFGEISDFCKIELSGNASKYSVNIGVNNHLNDVFIIIFSAAYNSRILKAKADENIVINLDSVAIDGVFRHNLDFSSESVSLNAGLRYDFSGTSGIGVHIDYEYIFSQSFDYNQTMIYPYDRGYFTDTGTRIRNITKGEIKSLNLNLISTGFYFYKDFPLDVNFDKFLTAKAGLSLPINNFTDEHWNFISYNISILVHL